MAGGDAYASPAKGGGTTLPGKPQDAWPNGSASPGPIAVLSGKGASTSRGGAPKRRNSIMDLLEKHGDNSKQLISRAGFEALCEQLGLRMNAIEKRRAFNGLDTMDGTKDGLLEYSYVRCASALLLSCLSDCLAAWLLRLLRRPNLSGAAHAAGPRLGQGQAPDAAPERAAARAQAVRHG
jgi:hypothetical protein